MVLAIAACLTTDLVVPNPCPVCRFLHRILHFTAIVLAGRNSFCYLFHNFVQAVRISDLLFLSFVIMPRKRVFSRKRETRDAGRFSSHAPCRLFAVLLLLLSLLLFWKFVMAVIWAKLEI